MGELSLAAKITHVPSMYLSELDGPHKGCREPAIQGHMEIGRRCRQLGVDTIVVFDTHWLIFVIQLTGMGSNPFISTRQVKLSIFTHKIDILHRLKEV